MYEIQRWKRIWALLTVQMWQDLGEFLRFGCEGAESGWKSGIVWG